MVGYKMGSSKFRFIDVETNFDKTSRLLSITLISNKDVTTVEVKK